MHVAPHPLLLRGAQSVKKIKSVVRKNKVSWYYGGPIESSPQYYSAVIVRGDSRDLSIWPPMPVSRTAVRLSVHVFPSLMCTIAIATYALYILNFMHRR